jgi:hypothetical protein
MWTSVRLPLVLTTHFAHSRLLMGTFASVYLVGLESTAQKISTTVNPFRVNTVLDVQMVTMLTLAHVQLDTRASIVPQILTSVYPTHAQTAQTVQTTLVSLYARVRMALLAKTARTRSKELHHPRQLHHQLWWGW